MGESGSHGNKAYVDPARTDRLFSAHAYLNRLKPHLQRFGITRLADVTGLDRIGIPVVQAVRPLARSNAVNQGKGLTLAEAAVSAVMEALETLAGETIGTETEEWTTPEAIYGPCCDEILSHHLLPDAGSRWVSSPIPFFQGTSILSGKRVYVPAALVSTDYTPGSIHAGAPFFRTTTGLGAGATEDEAVLHALFETLERHGTSSAMQTHGFFEKRRFDPHPVISGKTRQLLAGIEATGLLCAFYECPTVGDYPVIWARLLDEARSATSLPYHADGFACRENMTDAVQAALLEAVQTRASVIAGGREDITRQFYPRRVDEELLAFERAQMRTAPARHVSADKPALLRTTACLAQALHTEGLQAVVFPVLQEEEIPLYVVRVIALAMPEAQRQ